MIREIRESDRAEYIKMVTDFYDSPAVSHPIPVKHHEDAFEHMTTSGQYLDGYIFEKDGKTAGFCVVAKTYSPEAGGLVLWIEDLCVLPEYRSQGIGRKFFAFLEEKYKGTAVRWRLEITPENEGAKRLYKSVGFEECPYLPMIREINTK